jgi:amino acid adenylation domain-containing protein
MKSLNQYPLSSTQKEIWFEQLLSPNLPIYNIGGYLRISAAIDISIFKQAINQLIQECDALRIKLQQSSESFVVQTIEESIDLKLNYHEFSENSEAITWMNQEFKQAFKLEGELLFKFSLLKIADHCYYFFIKFHHLIVDGYAISLINKRLATIYNAMINQEQLDEVICYSYIDFVKKDQAYFDSDQYIRHQNYWLKKYQDIPAPFLKTATTFESKCSSLELNRQHYNQLIQFAESHNVSTFHVILGALYCYFTKIYDRDDFVIGLPILNRNSAAFKQTVGMFASVSAAWFRFGTDLNFIELIQAISQELKQNYRYQRFPISEINRQLGLQIEGRKQLFDITLSYEKHDYDVKFHGNSVEALTLDNGYESNALNIYIREFHNDHDVRVDIEYNLGAFTEAEIEQFKLRFKVLLSNILDSSHVAIRELQIMPNIEREIILTKFNQTATDDSLLNTNVIELFEQQVEKTPDKIAITFENQQLTYKQLNCRANQLAHYLQSLGVEPEVLIGLCIKRSPEMLIGLLGIMKAGAAYLPLDSNVPAARNAFLLEQAQVQVLVTIQSVIEGWSIDQAYVICLDNLQDTLSQQKTNNPTNNLLGENLAYVIYTSGSTGKPKGVMIEHHSLITHTQAIIEQTELKANDITLQFAPINFDVSIEEIFPSLLSGTTLVLHPSKLFASLTEFQQFLDSKQISVIHLPSSYWHEWVLELSKTKAKLPNSLRLVVTGNEKVMLDRVKLWYQSVGDQQVKLFNAYGPTEATITSTIYEVTPNINHLSTVPIGRPISNVQTYILDKYMQPTPIGIPGELHIAGTAIARGYLYAPELTEEKFVYNQFSDKSLLYKTGDIARYLPDGNIEYIGRNDNQVKIRGYRIELGEIEAALNQHPEVRETVVLTEIDKYNNNQLVAYIVSNWIPDRIPYQTACLAEIENETLKLRTEDISSGGVGLEEVPSNFCEGQHIRLYLRLPGEQQERWLNGTITWARSPQAGIKFHLTPTEQIALEASMEYLLEFQGFLKALQRIVAGNLTNYLKDILPKYMMPSRYVLLNALPRTANGKINRKAVVKTSIQKQQTPAEALTSTEKIISAAWSEILGCDNISIYDNFFQLGGHSLHVMQFVSRISVAMNIENLVKKLFDNPTIAELAKELDGIIQEQSTKKIKQQSELPRQNLPQANKKVILERRSLLSLFTVGKIPSVDAAAISYLPNNFLESNDNNTRDQIIHQGLDNLPLWYGVLETKWGRIALLLIPRLANEIYTNKPDIINTIIDAMEMATRIGARTVSLTGLIPSATDYGTAINEAIKDRNDLPTVTTGHTTTTATVILTIQKMLQLSNRDISKERVAFLGLGSIGYNSLRLMLSVLNHPAEIILCDIKREVLTKIKDELNFNGKILVSEGNTVPEEIYDASLIIGATNVPHILDINKVKSGTMIVDDSAPHCFVPEIAIERFKNKADILFSEAGVLKSPQPITEQLHLPRSLEDQISNTQLKYLLKHNSSEITGCIFSSLQTSVFKDIEATTGMVEEQQAVKAYENLCSLNFEAADLHCEEYVLSDEGIEKFKAFSEPTN